MNSFTIYTNRYLKQNIKGFYHTNYTGHRNIGNPDYLNDLKNTFGNFSSWKLKEASEKLKKVLKYDFTYIQQNTQIINLTICVIPRAKAKKSYTKNQLLFRSTVKSVIKKIDGFENGLKYIVRHTDTKTTHLAHSQYGGDGDMPYVGITKDTCTISSNVQGKDILLIDDIYTRGVNIDEDAIQALLDNGAKSVIFYAVGKTK